MADLIVYLSTVVAIIALALVLRGCWSFAVSWYAELDHGWDRRRRSRPLRPMATRRSPRAVDDDDCHCPPGSEDRCVAILCPRK